MKYHVQEATFEVPDRDMLDTSINILSIGDPKKPFSVVVTRDSLGNAFENAEQLLRKHLNALAQKQRQFKEHEFKKFTVVLPASSAKPLGEAVQAYVSYRHQGPPSTPVMHQKILVIPLLKDGKLLSIAGSHLAGWPEPVQAQWSALVSSFMLR